MKTKLVLSAFCIVMLIAGTQAQSANVYYVGTNASEWGGPIHWGYCYEVVLDPGEKITAFQIAYGDLGNIGEAVDSSGYPLDDWSATTLHPIPEELMKWGATPLGDIAPPPNPGFAALHWSGPELQEGPYYFGFNMTVSPCDAGFSFYGPNFEQHADWNAPVGMGLGPVWAPFIPEPATLALFGLGAMMLRRKR